MMDQDQPWWVSLRETLLSLPTPSYVYHQPTLEKQAKNLLSLGVSQVFYSLKANFFAPILQLFERLGLSFECVSWEEIEHLLRSCPGLDKKRILFTPNFAPSWEYKAALDLSITVTLDHFNVLQDHPLWFQGQRFLFRFDPGHGQGHHRHVHTAGQDSKFGISLSDLEFCRRYSPFGLHVHVGSGVMNPYLWSQNGQFLKSLLAYFPSVHGLNLGGGLGIPQDFFDPEVDMKIVAKSLKDFQSEVPGKSLWIESGRYLTAQSGVLLAKVTQVKKKGERIFVGLETGMNSLIRPALYQAFHPIENLTRWPEAKTEKLSVVGPICESGDVFGFDRNLPPTKEGDLLIIGHSGAYGQSMASSYNLRAKAQEFMLT